MTAADVPGEPPRTVSDASVGDLVRNVADDLTTLIRQEIALAKSETKAEVTKAGKAGGAFGGAGVAGWLALLFVSLAVMYGLGAVIPVGWAALIVGVLWAAGAAALAAYGRKKIRAVNPVPKRTVETVKEDVRWVQNRNA
ncbi:phage holin family protein [Cryptosporangium aurantiacum]|uniref:Putative Holin-X, holin superfamily III n=1 Tax=Cryptosporangium aurantiacum TaxID=134849 RepID=A0A1M7TUT0_9ACTN|nr:phage holin family protein [Cryptosporangium aurantiacum]SHN74470.1 Putative Holin-X, holin superfamily III [Cryptosporangium aurantiacum]